MTDLLSGFLFILQFERMKYSSPSLDSAGVGQQLIVERITRPLRGTPLSSAHLSDANLWPRHILFVWSSPLNELFPRDFFPDFARLPLGLSGAIFVRGFAVSF